MAASRSPACGSLCGAPSELSERTVRTALDQLEAEGIIRPCGPAVVAKIKRAGYRPQGWDLAMRLIREDLDDDEIESLARQFPGLATTRVGARKSRSDDGCSHFRDGVQPRHSNRP